MIATDESTKNSLQTLADNVKRWGHNLGFQQLGITDINLSSHRNHFLNWLDNRYHGEMEWMERHASKRLQPQTLLPETIRVISARMNYLPIESNQVFTLKAADKAYISRYALGRDYHKLIRKRLQQLAQKIERDFQQIQSLVNPIIQRPFVDSAPILEKAFAEKACLGWIGKNTLLINQHAGSWFFLGEIYTNIPLPIDHNPQANRCSDCSACLKICPTDAFVGPYQLDASRCISYLTIELKGPIPTVFRESIGNRVFGCDDCQIICPWNKFAQTSSEGDFTPRHQLKDSDLVTLFLWSEKDYLKYTEGSAIRRLGYERWLRNLAIGLGNANASPHIMSALRSRQDFPSELVQEHINWAIKQQQKVNHRRQRKIKR
jgi:epoxyqueuosine reductase